MALINNPIANIKAKMFNTSLVAIASINKNPLHRVTDRENFNIKSIMSILNV